MLFFVAIPVVVDVVITGYVVVTVAVDVGRCQHSVILLQLVVAVAVVAVVAVVGMVAAAVAVVLTPIVYTADTTAV